MGKTNSYHDWELQFRKKPKTKTPVKSKESDLNSLGISRIDYRRFLDEWRAKNLVRY